VRGLQFKEVLPQGLELFVSLKFFGSTEESNGLYIRRQNCFVVPIFIGTPRNDLSIIIVHTEFQTELTCLQVIAIRQLAEKQSP
jgi:hypothetical protein